MPIADPSPRDRVAAALCTAAVLVPLGWALLNGLDARRTPVAEESLELFAAAPERTPPPPVRVVRERRRDPRREGEAAPPNIRSEATQVVAPEPAIVLPVPPTITAAPVAGSGSAPTQGAAPVPGPGTGAGGVGQGRGSGGSGGGDGAGDVARWTPPKRVRGEITSADLPDRAVALAFRGAVDVRFFVDKRGRVSDCRVERSGGDPEIDALTCRLVERRFRYRPARDERGEPMGVVVRFEQEWTVEGTPDQETPVARSSRTRASAG